MYPVVMMGTTHFKIPITFNDEHAEIVRSWCRKYLAEFEWDARFKRNRYVKSYYIYDDSIKALRIPLGFFESFREHMEIHKYTLNVKQDEIVTPRMVELPTNPMFTDRDHQVDPINYLTHGSDTMRGLQLQTGCLVGSSIVTVNIAGNGGLKLHMKTLYNNFAKGKYAGKTLQIKSLIDDHVSYNDILNVVDSGRKEVYRMTLSNGSYIIGTPEHPVCTATGEYVPLINCLGKLVCHDSPYPYKLKNDGRVVRYCRYTTTTKHHPYATTENVHSEKPVYKVQTHIFNATAALNNFTPKELKQLLLDEETAKTLFFINTTLAQVHHINGDCSNDNENNLQVDHTDDHVEFHNSAEGKSISVSIDDLNRVVSYECVKIEYEGVEETYDISCRFPFHNFIANNIVVHNSGKTHCAIRALSNLGVASMVVASGLVEQWYESLEKYLPNKSPKDIYIIKGYKTLEQLLGTDIFPKVIVCSLETLRLYVGKQGNYKDIYVSYPEFLKKYGIGCKIFDEVHKNFHAITMMDLYSNIKNNIYLTATFASSNSGVRRIFNTVFPQAMRFGAETYNRYVDIYFCAFKGCVIEKRVVRMRGYSHARYEYEYLRKPNNMTFFVMEVLKPLIENHFLVKRTKSQKCLIFFATIQFINVVLEMLRREYPDLNILPYIGESPDSHLDDGVDIILSTHKSCGTGTDIKNLRTVINTVSVKAVDTLVKQILGRLRVLDGCTPIMVDMFDINLSSHFRHYKDRSTLYKQLGKSYHEYSVTPQY